VIGSFDRVAARYDETRGGDERGAALAVALDRHLLASGRSATHATVIEIGVGTAVIAAAMRRRGWVVTGLDIAADMLAIGKRRLPGALVCADAARLPLRHQSVDAVYGVWVLHVVQSVSDVVAEVSRVLRPGGRFVYVPSRPERPASDVDEILAELGVALRGGRLRADRAAAVREVSAGLGLSVLESATVLAGGRSVSPAEAARHLIERAWSPLWNTTDTQWDRHVQPAIDALTALPDSARQRTHQERYDVVIAERVP
jgi:ubiquinone/menaquinone biosynthesis C-methylase UbiE